MTLVLWDADYLGYAAGFAVQHTDRALIHKKDGEWSLSCVVEDNAEQFNLSREALEGETFTRTYLEDGALERALHNVKSMVSGTISQIEETFPDLAPFDFRFHLTGTGNFRDEIATIRPYKGNREKTSRPLLYADIRRWMVQKYRAVTSYGWEADDAIASEACAAKWKPILVHVDKDLLQLPGRHFIPGKGGKTVSKAGALTYFYRQMVTGDTADNIPGVYKAGAKAAEVAVTKDMTEAEMWEAVLKLYDASITKHGEATGYAHMGAHAAALENARLLWLVRDGKGAPLWMPPGSRQ